MTNTTSSRVVVPASNRAKMIKGLLTGNGGRFFSVTFIKANGEERTLTGNYGQVKSQTGKNTVADQEKYVTVILPTKNAKGEPDRRNVNCETVKSITTDGTTITFE